MRKLADVCELLCLCTGAGPSSGAGPSRPAPSGFAPVEADEKEVKLLEDLVRAAYACQCSVMLFLSAASGSCSLLPASPYQSCIKHPWHYGDSA